MPQMRGTAVMGRLKGELRPPE